MASRKPRVWTQEESSRLLKAWSGGQTPKKLSEEFGVTVQAILSFGKARGLPPLNLEPKKPRRKKAKGESAGFTFGARTTPRSEEEALAGAKLREDAYFQDASDSVSFLQLDRHHCKWPLTADDGTTRYCGCRRLSGMPYCQKHHDIAYEAIER